MAAAAIAALSTGFGVVDAEAGVKPFEPVADAYVSKAKSKANFGKSKSLVVDGSPVARSYVRFNVRGLGGAVSYATLQLTARSASTRSVIVRRAAADHWGEKRIRFGNAPKLVGPTAKARGVKSFRTTSINVTRLVRGNGVVTFVLTASGRGGATFWSSESIKALRPVLLVGVNEAPVCADVFFQISEDTPGTEDPSCTDAERDRLTYQIVSQGANGTASVVDGKLRYVPHADSYGADRFTYRAKDGRKVSKAVTALVSIKSINDAPACAPRALTVDEDGGGAVGHLCSDVDGDSLTVSITSGAQNGTSTVVAGELRYTPNANTNGPDAFTYRARDTTLASAPATVSVFVNPVNDAPVCGNVSVTTFEDVPGDVNPSCSDIDGDPLAYGIAGHGAKGTGSVIGGTLRFTPTPNLNGGDAFTYFASDGNAASPPATASVAITAVNDAPFCQPLPLATAEDTPREINPNCTDVEGDPMTYSIVSQGSKGTASVSGGRLRYVPNLDLTGADTFTYRAQDAALASAAATVSVSIGAVNDAPVCVARSLSLDEDAAGTTAPSCSDLDGDTLTFSIVAQGTKGAASVVSGNLRYAGNPNANGSDSFTYQANDGGLSSAPATVTVTIRAVNDAPVCADVTLATNEDAMGERDPSCSDIDGDALTYSTASQGMKGAASVVAGKLRYVPNANANGPDSFTYQARDGALSSAAAIVAVTIAPVNDAPTCAGVSLTTDEDVPGEQNPSCADIDGDSLTYAIGTPLPTKGTASITAANKLRFAPNANANGTDTFTYRASDGAATSALASVATTIRAVNDTPTCANVSLATDEDVIGERDPSCSDIDGDPLTYSIVAQAGKGTASVVAGKLRFVPNANANGPDSFTYRASDGAAASSAPALVTVTIAAVNDAPTCANVSLATDEDVMAERDPSCSDIDGDAMTYAIVAPAARGTASVVANRLRYVPNANLNGPDSFTYRASDGALTSTPATVSATVAPINDAPTCANAPLTTNEDVIGERDAPCSDIDGNPLTYSIVTQGTKGTASVAVNRLRYDPNENVNGADSFTFRATDGTATTPAATIAVTITAVNDAPVCAGVTLTMSEDGSGEQNPSCTDVDGDPLTYSIASPGSKGTASVVANRLRYVPNANANGTDSFTYRASDGPLSSVAATASVSITAVNDAPTCASVGLTTNEDVMGERDPSCSDVDGDVLTYSIGPTPVPTKGTAMVVAGKLRYTPTANQNGGDSFGYRATDGTVTSTATVSVTINPVNDAPTCAGLTLATDEDVTAERDPSCADVDGDTLTYAIFTPATKGTASVVAGRLRYAPNTNANGADSFAYRANDGITNSSVATVTVTVTAVNDAPVCSPLSLAIDEGGTGNVSPICSDAEGASLSYAIAAQGTKGVASVAGASLRYVGNPNTSGLDSFTYTANDGEGPSAPATVSVSIGEVNDPPICNARTLTLDEDAASATVAPLCTDPDGDPVTIYSIGAQAAKGTASVDGGNLKYVPNLNANGADSFTYRASDGVLTGAPATVSVTINPVNDAPSCAGVPLTTNEDTMGERDPSCTDVDGDLLTYAPVAPAPTKGTASVVAGKLRYVPNANATGPDSFGYRASDGVLPSPAATVSVSITPVNDAPVCQPLPLDTPEDTTGHTNPNCSDVENDPLSYSIVSPATKGTASVSNGRLRYVPNLNVTGADSFTYRAQDASAASAAATVSVSITGVNDAPVCAGRTLTLDEDAAGTTAPSCSDVDGDTLNYSVVAQGTKGSASVVAGNLHYAGNLNANGADSFTYQAHDGGLPSTPAAVSVTINPVNDAPVCTDVTLATNEDTTGERDPVCSDVDGDALTYQTASQGLKGTASVVAGKLRYLPNANANGTDSFTYLARDAALPSAAAIVAVSIAPANDAPVCAGVSLTTDEDVAGEQNPSCTDIDGDPLTYSIATPATNGSASISGGKLRYLSNANVNGSDSFGYRAGDGSAQSTPANVAVTIRAVNDAPNCLDVTLATEEDVAGQRDPSCSDIDGDALTYSIVAQGSKGTASVIAGKLRYAPNANLNGADSFTYRATDGAAASSAAATATVAIAAVNDAPACSGVSLTTLEDATGERDPSCSDIDGDALTYSIAGQGAKGTASVVAGKLRYAPAMNANGPDSFTYQANDGTLSSSAATVSVSITAVNDAPACANVALTVLEDTMGERDPSCTDVEGNTLTYSIVAQATKGTASVVAGKLRYTPNASVTGTDSFTYQASDGALSSPIATVSVTITPSNDPPSCSDVALTTDEDVVGERDPACADIDGDTLTYEVVAQGTKGTASIAAGKLHYVPNPNVVGTDSFTYRAFDGRANSGVATVSVTIRPTNDAPTCAGVSLTTDEDAAGERDPSCTDIDGDSLTYSIATPAASAGTASVTPTGRLRYAPNTNVNGGDSFGYRATDGGGLSSTPATVSVTIRPVNDTPVCAPVNLTTNEEVAGERDPACTDVDGDTLIVSILAHPSKGTASVTTAGKLRYAPNLNATGADTFTYRADDSLAISAAATVSVTINPVNDAPTCSDVNLATNEDVPAERDPACTDIDGDTLMYSIVAQGSKGSASVVAGKLRYAPNANLNGADSFTYRASDGGAQTSPATVSVSIAAVNDAPVCQPVSLSTPEETPGEVDPNCTDVDGNPLTYSIVTQGSKGAASVVAGRLRYAPNVNATGADSFTYQASDGPLTGTAAVSVTIAGVNDPPVCAALTMATNEDTMGERDPSCTDIDNDPLTYSIATPASKGTASVVAGRLRYVPNANVNGTDVFAYRAGDGGAQSAPVNVTVSIAAVNDTPVCADVQLTTNEEVAGERDPSCTDVDGDTLTYAIVAHPTKGSASVVAGKLRYVPNLNATGSDSFTYRALDATTLSAPATVSVTINGVNDAPTCSDVTLATSEDTMGERDPVCTDIDGDSLTYSVVDPATNGTASVAAGKLRYVPNANFNGGDSFTYRAGDGTATSGPANVSVTVTQVNDSPVCPDRSLTIAEDGEGSITPVCSDPEGDAVSLQIAGQGLKGTASVVGTSLRYVGNPDANGVDSFLYRATDGALSGAPATVTVTINPANDAPVCAPVTLATSEDTMGERDPSCTDIDGDGLTYAIVAPASQGTASVVAGKLRYVPSPNTNGADSFTYQATDGGLASGAATVSVSITPVNDAPTCSDVTLATSEDTMGERDPVCGDIDGDGLTFSIVAQGSKGTASVVAGKLRYVPSPNANGSDSFTYRATDGGLPSGPATVSVSITAVNDAPSCSDVALTTNEDTMGEQNPACADVDGNPLSYSIVASGSKGTASVVAGKLRYVPNPNVTGGDSFTYRANDGPANSNTATVTVTINAVNDAPVCGPVSLTTDEDVAGQQDPSCSDIDGDALTYTIVGPATQGSASVVAGKLRYAPNANFNGSDSFTYRAADASASSTAATVEVTINAVNDAPSCSNVGLTTDEDTMGERDPSCSDIDGDTLTYAIVGQGTKGFASVVAGKLRYVPNANVNGSDSFTYQASDGSLSSAPATVSVTITAVNNAPSCANVSLATDEDVSAERDPSCTDIDSGTLTYSIVASGTKGTASVVAGKLRYVPNPNVNGADSFTYKANDGSAHSNVATVSVTIAAVNDAPVAQNLSVTTPEDTAKDVTLSATDVEGSPVTFTIVTPPAQGTLSGTGATRTYTPDANYNGPDSFTYKANDGSLDSSVATVSVTVTAVNDPPVAQNLSATTPEETPKDVVLSATDIEGNPLTFSIVASPAHGTLTGTGANRTYTPAANYNGPDSFTYKANDGADSNVATVSLTVTAVNDPPVARDVAVTTPEDTPALVTLDATDVEGDPLTYTIVSGPANGVLVGTGPVVTYTPNLNYSGPDSFTYKVNDGTSDSTVATVTITVTPVNDPPIAQDLTSSTPEDTSKGVVLSGTDAEGDTLGFTIVTPPSHGGLFGGGANRTYTPDPNYNGPDSFTYRANDGVANSNVATVTLTVTPVNDAPSCPARTLTLNEDNEGSVTPVCTDPESDAVSLEIVGQGLKGTASVVGNALRYLANSNANGSDSFTYRATDGSLVAAPATVSVTINPVNDGPVCAAVTLATSEDTTAERDPSCTDIDGDGLTYSIVAGGAKGAASVVAGKLRYVPHVDATGADSFTYRATDGGGLSSAPATVSVTIAAVNDAPSCFDVSMATSEETPAERDPSCSDVDGDALTYSIVAQGTKGSASVVAGKLRYVPNVDATGADSFTYRATDGGGLSSSPAMASVTIASGNDAPTCSDAALTTDEDVMRERDPACADIDGDALTHSIVAQGTKGTASVVAGKLRYVPDQNTTGADSFTYKANDGAADSNVATVSVTINPVNDAPTCSDVPLAVTEDSPADRDPACADIDAGTLSYSIVASGTKGTASISAGKLRYVPNLNATGGDSFTYRANDGGANSNTATVTVTISAVNDPPVARDVPVTTAEDVPATVVLDASDVDGVALGYTIVSGPTHGILAGGGATRTYTPDANYNGPDSFTYRVNDGSLDSNVATVTLTVTPVNDAPSCPAQPLIVTEDGEASITPVCSDPEGDPLSLQIAAAALKGTASVVGNSLRYVADGNATGTDSFTYRASDGSLTSAPAMVSVTITAVNDAPVCEPVTLATSEDTAVERDPSCTDVDGDVLTHSIVAPGSKGTASVTAGQKLRYVPNLNANGSDSFTYRASDGLLTSGSATASVTISPVNDAPVCPAQSLTIDEDTVGSVTPVCVDAENDPISLEIVSQALDGTASVVGGSLRFIPFVDANGPDSFTYRGRDSALAGPTAIVSVTVNPVNDEPEAIPADVSTDKGVAKVITLAGFDYDNDPLTFRIVSLPANGNLRAGPNATDHLITAGELPYSLTGNQVRYEPNAAFTGSNSFQFRAHDGTIAGLPADVRISVVGANVAPVCSPRTLNVDEDATLTETVCSDADDDPMTYTRTGPTHGQLTLFDDGSFQYVPGQNYNGPDSFTVVARDPSGLASTEATVSITVAPVNDAPTCNSVALSTPPDTPGATFPDCGDVDGDTLTYEIVAQPLNGTASVSGQQLGYIPALGYTGPDSFTYRAGDGTLFSGPATVSVTVMP